MNESNTLLLERCLSLPQVRKLNFRESDNQRGGHRQTSWMYAKRRNSEWDMDSVKTDVQAGYCWNKPVRKAAAKRKRRRMRDSTRRSETREARHRVLRVALLLNPHFVLLKGFVLFFLMELNGTGLSAAVNWCQPSHCNLNVAGNSLNHVKLAAMKNWSLVTAQVKKLQISNNNRVCVPSASLSAFEWEMSHKGSKEELLDKKTLFFTENI